MKKQDLIEALEIVKPGLANKELIEQSTTFAFMNGGVTTYNDEISITHPVEGLDFTAAIQAKEMYEILKKMKTDEIDLSFTDTEVILSSGKAKAGIIINSEIKLPLEEIKETGKWKPVTEALLNAMKICSYSSATGIDKPILTCVHVNKKGFVEGSDGFKITHFNVSETDFPFDTFLIPSKSVSEVLKIQPNKISKGNGWIHFKNEKNTVISCRIFEDTFPDCSPFLKASGKPFNFPNTIMEMVNRAEVFNTNQLEISLTKNKLNIASRDEGGWFEEAANVKYDGENIKFMIAPLMLKSVIDHKASGEFCGSSLKFTGENWITVIALLISK